MGSNGPTGAEFDDLARLLSPALLARRLRVRVMRPRDHLILDVGANDCAVVVAEDVPYLVPDGPRPRLVVTLPPQHVAEQVYQQKQAGTGAPEDPALPAGARFAAPTRLVYVLDAADRVKLTIDGVLDAMGTLVLAVVALAEPRFSWRLLSAPALLGHLPGTAAEATVDRVRAMRLLTAQGLRRHAAELRPDQLTTVLDVEPELREELLVGIRRDLIDPGRIVDLLVRPDRREPTWLETAIEVPSRLQLSPSTDGAWAHTRTVDPTPDAVVELWHTRLGVRTDSGVDEQAGGQRIVRAVWTRDLGGHGLPSATHPFRMSLTPKNRADIVELSTGAPGSLWRRPAPSPVEVDRLHLTSLGAFIDVRGNWDVPGKAFTEWQHRTTLGRDQYVRVVLKGYLFPFGHRAVLVTETRRRADPQLPDGDFAILWQRHFIVLRDQVRSYGNRIMPFSQVTLSPKVTPDINDPGPDPTIVWPMVDTAPFAFTVTGVDRDGITHRYTAPLLWVAEREDGKPAAGAVLAQYGLKKVGAALHDDPSLGFTARVEQDLRSRRVAVAARGPSGEAAYETRTLRFAAHPEATTCEPFLLHGDFVVPAVTAVTGSKNPLRLSYAGPYLAHGFDAAGNKGEVVLAKAEGVTLAPLSYGSTDRSGGFLKPSQHIDGIARGTGPVSDVAATASGTPTSPTALFAGLGKILGLFDLADILPPLGLDQVPAYASRLLDLAGAIAGGLTRASAMLAPTSAARAQLQDAAAGLDVLMRRAAPPPTAAEFTTLISTKLSPAIAAARGELAALGMARAAIVRRALDTVDSVLNNPTLDAAAILAGLAAGVPSANILTHVHLAWQPPVRQWPGSAPKDAIFLPAAADSLLLAVDIRGGDLVAEPSTEVLAQLTDFTLQLLPGVPLLHIPFTRLYFRASTGAKSEIDVDMGPLKWLGVLGFVDKLRELIPGDGFSDPPAVTVDSAGITTGFSVVLPNVAVGVFNLSNLSLAAQIQLPFIGDDGPTVGFAFCSRERPFNLSVLFMGGGGFFGLRISPKKLVLLEASLEFGATLALDFGVASGSVSAMAGVYLRLAAAGGSLTGYLRIRGEVDVLGLISACIELYMALEYEFGSGKVRGRASITVEVEVLMFSASVRISTERTFAGSKGDPTFADALGPFVDGDCPWIDYCQAFAEV
ncbi:hypothetical protein [Actinokineospora sp.]|uniref:hypothetical protein n=1 Tax=Actinokineospora sp. TaxID=1872133 RepID=UPI003D6BFA07